MASDERAAPVFTFYLERHIELDSDEHGPAALKMLKTFTDGNDVALMQLEKAAEAAIKSRLMFWDTLADRNRPPAADLATEGACLV